MPIRVKAAAAAKAALPPIPSQRLDQFVTGAVIGEVGTWQSRRLEQMYPVVFFDAMRVKIRDESVVRRYPCVLP